MKKYLAIGLVLAGFWWGFGGLAEQIQAAEDCEATCEHYTIGSSASLIRRYDECMIACRERNLEEEADQGNAQNQEETTPPTVGEEEEGEEGETGEENAADVTGPLPRPSTEPKAINPCDNLPPEGQQKCNACMGYNPDRPTGVWTGLGCVSTNPIQAFGQILTFLLGLGGFFVVAQILVGAFGLVTSKGNPKAVQDARERITNAIIALLFIVFSVTILEFMGVSILNLPGFFDSSATPSMPALNCTKAGGCNCATVQLTDRCQSGEFEAPEAPIDDTSTNPNAAHQ